MSDLDQAWCPTCQEWTVIDVGRPCAWCETLLVRKPGGWKRPDLVGLISEASARAIHAKYETGISARKLGQQLHQVLGYKTPQTCEAAIGVAFKRYGLPVRDRIAATILASTTRGLSPRDHRERSRRRREAGLTYQGMRPRRPACEGIRRQAPRKGERCERPAMNDSAFCFNHDLARRAQMEAITARMRERQPRKQMVAWETVRAQLAPWLTGQTHPAARLHEATGVPHATCSRLLLGRIARVSTDLADRLLVAVEMRAAA